MTKRGDPFNSYSHSKNLYPNAQNLVQEIQTPHSNKKSAAQNQQLNDLNIELAQALRRVELLKAERNQLKDALKAVLERRPSDNVLNLNQFASVLSPSKPSSENERPLQKENNELREELKKRNEQLAALRKENFGYLTRLEELERINEANILLKAEMEKITGELAGMASNTKRFEHEKAPCLSNSRLGIKMMKYINHTLDLIEKYDPAHFLKTKFYARFESSKKIQELVDRQHFESLVTRAFKYISDLVANPYKANYSPKQNTSSIKKSVSVKRSATLPVGRGESPVTSAFEENIPQTYTKHSKQGKRSRDVSPQRVNVNAAFTDNAKIGHDSSRALKKIIKNISAPDSRSRDNTRQSSPVHSQERPNIEPRFVIDTPREADSQQKDQKLLSPRLQTSIQSPIQRQELMFPRSPHANQGIKKAQSSPQKFFSQASDIFGSRSQSLSGQHLPQYQDQQRLQSPLRQSANKHFFYQNRPLSVQVPIEHTNQYGPMYFPPQQNIWVKNPYMQEPHFNRRQSEQVSTGIPVTLSNSFLSNYSPRNYESMLMQSQSSPKNKFYFLPPYHSQQGSQNPSELASPHPYDQNPPQPHAYQPSPSYQRYYQPQPKAPQFFNPNYLQPNFNRGEFLFDRNNSQNVLEPQELSHHRVSSNDSYNQSDPKVRQYDSRNDIPSYRGSDPNIGSTSYGQEFHPNSPTYYSGQQRAPSLDHIDRSYPQNEFVRGPDTKLYGYGYVQGQGSYQQDNVEILSPTMYSNTPYFISAKQMQNIDVIPEESDRHNYSETKQKYDKQIQIETNQNQHQILNSADNVNDDRIYHKGTQSSSPSLTPTSKLSSKRENIPSLNFEALQKQKERLVVPPIGNEPKNLHYQQKNHVKSASVTPKNDMNLNKSANEFSQGITPNDSSEETSQLIHRNYNKQSSIPAKNEYASAPVGRATLGVMGNQELIQKASKKVLNVSSDELLPSLNSSNQKSFRVSFGKTLSLIESERPRFEIVPNDTICIVEVPRKKHINHQRNFDIISNESRSLSVTPESTNQLPNPTPQRQMNEVSTSSITTSPQQKS